MPKAKLPWWQVRRVLVGALVLVSAGLTALWIEPELRASFFATFVAPLDEMLEGLNRSDLSVALGFSICCGLLIGRGIRRERLRRNTTQCAQLA